MLCHLGYTRTWDLTTVQTKLKYAGVTDFYCGKLPQEILAFGTGISRKNRRFCHKSYPKQQNGKLEIPCKQTNQRLWVSTLLTYVDFNSNSHMSISWFSFWIFYDFLPSQIIIIVQELAYIPTSHYCLLIDLDWPSRKVNKLLSWSIKVSVHSPTKNSCFCTRSGLSTHNFLL